MFELTNNLRVLEGDIVKCLSVSEINMVTGKDMSRKRWYIDVVSSYLFG